MTKAKPSDRPKLANLRPGIALLDTAKATPLTGGTGEDRSWRADKRGSTERLYTYKWQQASKGFLRQHPLCQCPDCRDGLVRVRPATVVDHHIPHRGDYATFWDRSNWTAMAKACHDLKTQAETREAMRGQTP